MIQNEAELQLVREQMQRLENTLSRLRAEIEPKSPQRFALMAESYIETLAEFRVTVDEYLGISAIREREALLVVALDGEGVRLGDTRASVVTRVVDAVRKGVRGIVSAMPEGNTSGLSGGRKPKWLDELTDLPLAAIAPGSVRVILGEPAATELFSGEQRALLGQAIALLNAAGSASGSTAELAAGLRDVPEAVRNAVLLAIRDIAPPRQSEVETISLSSRLVEGGKVARINKGARLHVAEVMKTFAAMEDEYVFVDGDIREVDLDERTFELRNAGEDGPDWVCEYVPEFAEEVVSLLGTRVSIVGAKLRSNRPRLEILSISPIDGREAGADGGPVTEGGEQH